MKTKEELQERAQLVRALEACCNIEYPTPQEANFRLAIMKRLALDLDLKELKHATIDGPGCAPGAPEGGAKTSPRPRQPMARP
jgi:hypothetical protein